VNLSCHPDDEAILGDLHERYQTGRSRLWYWRQTAIAIFNSLVRETWGFKLQSAAAVTVGWLSLGLIWLFLEGLTAQKIAWNRHVCTFFWCIAGAGSGSIVGLLTQDRKRPMIILYAASVAGFLIALHRAPRSHTIVYWIDMLSLTISILLAAIPIALPAQQPIAPAGETK